MRNKIAGGINAVGARYSRKIKNSHPLKALRRGAAYGFGAASLGMVGLAAGIASGDPGKAFQYATGAAYVGGNLAKNTSDSLADEGNGTVQDWKEGWYGAEYDEHMQEKEIKQMQADYDNIAYLKDREPDEYKDILKHVYPAYARSGCADIKDFYAAYQLEESGLSRDSAISTYKLAQRVGDVSSSPDAESKWQKRLQEEFNNTSAVRIRQQNIAEQYRKEMERLQQEYEQNYKKVEATRAGDIREKLAVLQEQRKKQVEAMQRQQQEEQQQVSATLAQSAMKNIKQFYKNK